MSTPAEWLEHARAASRRRSATGDGPVCPEDGHHGRTYATARGFWCPVSQTIFAAADGGHAIGPVIRQMGPR